MEGIDRQGMLQDVRAIARRVWAKNNYSLHGDAITVKNEAEQLAWDLAVSIYCPDLRGFPLQGAVESGSFRCGNCDQMQHGGSLMIWVSDSTMMGDPQWAVIEELQDHSGGTGWCVPCVRKLLLGDH